MKELIANWLGLSEKLAEAENKKKQVQSVLEQSVDAVVTIDNNNIVTFYNDAAHSLWGYTSQEVVGKNVKLLVPDEIRSQHDNLVNANRRTGIDKIVGTNREVEIQRKDGSRIWGSLSLSRVKIGSETHYTAFVRDITEEKNNRDFINQTLEQAIDGVITIDDNNNIVLFNKAAEALWGYSREEVVGKNVRMLVPEEFQKNHDNFVNANRSTKVDKIVGTSREVEIARKDGNRTWANLSLSRIEMGDKIHYTAFVKDITEEKIQRDYIGQVLEQAIDGVVSIDADNTVTFFNKAAEELWGYSREEVVGKNVKMLVPVEIQGKHDQFVGANRATGVDKIVGTSREVPVFRKDGSQKWGNLALSKVYSGDEIHYTAFVRDVTEEVNRREEFERLSLVANETDNSVVITDADGLIEYVNPGFEKLTGYTHEQVLGKKPGDVLQGPDTDVETKKRIREKLNSQEPFYDEILNYDSKGGSYWISLAINPVFDKQGKLDRFISIQTNITETKMRSLEFNYKLDAIGRANAVAEFSLDGCVEMVNENYLAIFDVEHEQDIIGKRLDELLHRDFVGSIEHEEFWQTLKDGEFASGDFRHQTTTKEERWINGSFNPIFNTAGEMTKIVMYGEDATDRKRAINGLASVLSQLEAGNLMARLEGDFGEELNTVRDSLNVSMEKLQDTMNSILEVVDHVHDGSAEIANGNTDLSSRVESQAASLEETSSTMEELTSTARNNAENASAVNSQAHETKEAAERGIEVVKKAVASMGGISDSSKKISDIIGVIDEIAFQTNLLALNAAVEAARAGEQGRGFAVVAGEVRNLAQRSAQAAKEIGTLITDSVGKVSEGTELVNESGKTLEEIASSVLEVTGMVNEITQASRSQLEGIQQANSAVNDMDTITQQNAALVEEVTSASAEMTSTVEKMRRDIQFFKTD